MKGEALRDPEVVRGEGENITLTEGERKVLALGPKFCMRNDLNEELFEVALEECITKVRWDMKAEEEKKNGEELADIAMREIFTAEENEEIDEEIEIEDAKHRMVFNREGNTWSYSRKKIN